jgi:hypothetical protein
LNLGKNKKKYIVISAKYRYMATIAGNLIDLKREFLISLNRIKDILVKKEFNSQNSLPQKIS